MSDSNLAKRGIVTNWTYQGEEKMQRAGNQRQTEQKQYRDFRWRLRGAVLIGIAVLVLFAEFFKGEPEPSRLSISILFMLVLGAVMLAMGRQDQP